MDRTIEKKKGLQKKHIPYVAGGALGVWVVLWLAFADHGATTSISANELTINEVKQEEFKDYIRLNGAVVPIQVVQISPEEGGIVVEKVAEEGAQVKRGDVIVRLSNSNLDLQILNAEADLAEKQNLLRNTQVAMQQDKLNNETEAASLELEVTRKRRAFEQDSVLYLKKVVSREEYTQAKEDYELALQKQTLITERLKTDAQYRTLQMDQMEENLANMRKNVLLVRKRKDNLEVRSTIDGELGLLDVEIGQSISPGSKIGQLNDLSDYKIQADIDEHYIDRVRQGLLATFTKGDKDYQLVVRKVYPEVRQGRFRTEFVFRGDRPDNIRSGQTYYLNLELGQSEMATLLPRGAFFQTTGGKWIFVLSKDGSVAHRREIHIGRQNPQSYEVIEGLEPGERVITSNYDQLKKFERIEIKR